MLVEPEASPNLVSLLVVTVTVMVPVEMPTPGTLALLVVVALITKEKVGLTTPDPVSNSILRRYERILNFLTDAPGVGGFSGSGDAVGGDAGPRAAKRANDAQTAGGNAYSGNGGSTSSGSVSNVGGDDSAVSNTAASSKSLNWFGINNISIHASQTSVPLFFLLATGPQLQNPTLVPLQEVAVMTSDPEVTHTVEAQGRPTVASFTTLVVMYPTPRLVRLSYLFV